MSLDNNEMEEPKDDKPCNGCTYAWIIKDDQGRYFEVNAGKVRALTEANIYCEEGMKSVPLGTYAEFLGGNIGKLIMCIYRDRTDLRGKKIKILLEGRMVEYKIPLSWGDTLDEVEKEWDKYDDKY